LIAVGHEIRRYIPDAKDFEYSAAVTAGRRIESLTLDVPRGLVYWTDTSLKSILRAVVPSNSKLVAEPQVLNIAGLMSPTAVALDWVARVLYWTDREHGTISASTEDGRYSVTLIRDKQLNPQSIAVNPSLGLMYWTNVNMDTPSIQMASMTGANRITLVDTRLGQPVSITIDYNMGHRVYWCDSKENSIESMKFDGTDRITIFRGAGLNHPVSVDVFENWMYFASEQNGLISIMDKFGRDGNKTLQAGLYRPHSILVYHPLRYNLSVKNRCEDLGCWPLCLLSPSGGQCVCPDHSSFLPNSTTICDVSKEAGQSLPQTCPCLNAGVCVPWLLNERHAGIKTDFKCQCPEGYRGDLCEEESLVRTEGSAAWVAIIILTLLLIITLITIFIWYCTSRRGKSTHCIPPLSKSRLSAVLFSNNAAVRGRDETGIAFSTLENETTAYSDRNENTSTSGHAPGSNSNSHWLSDGQTNGPHNQSGTGTDFTNPLYSEMNPSCTNPFATDPDSWGPNPAVTGSAPDTRRTAGKKGVKSAVSKPHVGIVQPHGKPAVKDTGKDTQQLIESDSES